jgi:hypothetical protein
MGLGGTQRSVVQAKDLYIAPNFLFNWDHAPRFDLVRSNWDKETTILGVASFQPHLHESCGVMNQNPIDTMNQETVIYSKWLLPILVWSSWCNLV